MNESVQVCLVWDDEHWWRTFRRGNGNKNWLTSTVICLMSVFIKGLKILSSKGAQILIKYKNYLIKNINLDLDPIKVNA